MTSYQGLPPLKVGLCRGPLLLPRPSSSAPPFMSFGPVSVASSSVIGRSQALKIHSQAEKRRRERINSHLSSLRRMVPDSSKMDKASLLGRVIDHVKDLKRKARDAGKGLSVPSELNEVAAEARPDQSDGNKSFFVRASLCCEDRPDLFVNLMRTFHGLRLRAVSTDIVSLGGRVQIALVLCGRRDGGEEGSGGAGLSSVEEAVKEALARIASFDGVATEAPSSSHSSKRQRLLQSYYSSVSI